MTMKITIKRPPKKEAPTIKESHDYIQKLVSQHNLAWSQTDLDGECQRKYGTYWVYDRDLDACVERMSLESKQRIIRIKV